MLWIVNILFVMLIVLPFQVVAAGDKGKPAAPRDDPAGIAFFEQKIRPVLVEHCYKCHSVEAKKDKGKLLLDSRDSIRKGGESGPGVVPGKPKESWVLKALRHDGEVRMPPDNKLPAAVVANFEKWIAIGARDPRAGKQSAGKGFDLEEGRKFWCYQPLRAAAVPVVKAAPPGTSAIDRFLLASLEQQGLGIFPQAERRTLVRRASFALIGLPPTPEEIDAFLADQAGDLDAFAKVVDRLLASPHFGERWGRHWLDVARYAESSGGGRSLLFKEAWRYRDYVIGAFNADMPFNQFLIEQIAGDLLEAKTPEDHRRLLIATAFLLLGPHNYERQDKPILEMDIIDEQVDTIGKAFLGQTIGCARCHDHKFDPIPTRDYYALAGIFKSTRFIVHDNVSQWTEMPLPMDPAQEILARNHDSQVAAIKTKIQQLKDEAKKAGKLDELVLTTKGAIDPKSLPGIVLDDEQAKKIGAWKHSVFTGNFVGKGYLYDDRAFNNEKTLTFQPHFARSGFYDVRLAYIPHENRADKVPLRIFHADGDVTRFVNQKKTPPIEGRWISLGRYRFEEGDQWFVMVLTDQVNGHVVADAVQFLPDEDAKKVAPPAKEPRGLTPPAQENAGDLAGRLKTLEDELKRLQTSGPKRPMAMAVGEAAKIEDSWIAIRGNVHNKGEIAPRGFLQAAYRGVPPKLSAKESGRRELAQWIASPENPLTARVTVNRLWHHLFGAGLVGTVDNFGATGERPSHPELLDHLARRFIEQGWSVKTMIREMMLTQAYMRASAGPRDKGPGWLDQAHKIDPENRLLWKMNRRRLEAEAIRDTMLVLAGTLDRAQHGPTMKPGTAAERDYQFTDTRRSVYTPIFRNRLHELFEVFDFADPNTCNGQRTSSTVSTQALYLLNSPFVMEQAQRAAQRSLAQQHDGDAARLDALYLQALGRRPTQGEVKLALDYLTTIPAATPEQRLAAWERLHQALFGCIDFRYVN